MCPRKPKAYRGHSCGHPLPAGFCVNYAVDFPGGARCLDSDPMSPIIFDWNSITKYDYKEEPCWFCRTGRNINIGGKYRYGAIWADRVIFRK